MYEPNNALTSSECVCHLFPINLDLPTKPVPNENFSSNVITIRGVSTLYNSRASYMALQSIKNI